MLKEQALLLRNQLHLDCVFDEKLFKCLWNGEHVVLSRLHPQSAQFPRLSELGFRQLCKSHISELTFVLHDWINTLGVTRISKPFRMPFFPKQPFFSPQFVSITVLLTVIPVTFYDSFQDIPRQLCIKFNLLRQTQREFWRRTGSGMKQVAILPTPEKTKLDSTLKPADGSKSGLHNSYL